MSVKAETLDNGERDLELATRDPKGAKTVRADIQRVKNGTPTTEEQLQALRQRISAAQSVGADPQPHCGDCWKRGWTAAVRQILGES